MSWAADQIWRIAQACRDAVNAELYAGQAARDSTALSELHDGSALGLENAACFSIGGAPGIQIAVILVPTDNQHYASVEDTRRALGQAPG